MTPEERSRIEGAIADLMIEHGPDGHIDGYEVITDFVVSLVDAERARAERAYDEGYDEGYAAGQNDGWDAARSAE